MIDGEKLKSFRIFRNEDQMTFYISIIILSLILTFLVREYALRKKLSTFQTKEALIVFLRQEAAVWR